MAGKEIAISSLSRIVLILKAYLKFMGIDFVTVPSNNHASPTGALPFLIPASSSPFDTPIPIPSNKLQKWAQEQNVTHEELSDMRYDAYMALLDHRIRDAWVCPSKAVQDQWKWTDSGLFADIHPLPRTPQLHSPGHSPLHPPQHNVIPLTVPPI